MFNKYIETKSIAKLILCILLYGINYIISERLSDLLNADHIITILTVPLFLSAVLLYLKKKGLNKKVYINLTERKKASYYLRYIPLLTIPLFYIAYFITEYNSGNFNYFGLQIGFGDIILATCFIIGEEIIFRGIVLAGALKIFKSVLKAVLISSVLFSLMHAANLLSGQSPVYTLFQMIYAGNIGIVLCVITLCELSIAPAVILHFLFNLPGLIYEKSYIYSEVMNIEIICLIISFFYVFYCGSLLKKKKTRPVNRILSNLDS